MIFETWLKNRLIEVTKDLGLSDIEFDVYNEQDFAKHKEMKEKRIFVCVKHLTASRIYNSQILPLQITILSEQNTLEYSQLIFEKLCSVYNWFQVREGNTAYKMQFSSPAVMNNFNIVGSGFRSILFVSASLIVLENIADVESLIVDTHNINFITFTLNYGMSCDSQPYPNQQFVKSVKTVQMLTATLIVPCTETDIVDKALDILSGTISGNTDFNIKVKFSNKATTYEYNMKLVSCDFVTAANDIPSIQLGLSL